MRTPTPCWLITALLFCCLPGAALGASLTASDSIAGLPVTISASALVPSTSYSVAVAVPIGPTLVLPLQSNEAGAGEVRLSSADTQVAGRYTATLELKGKTLRASTAFAIEPDSFSAEHSTLESDRASLTPNGSDEVLVTVILRDQYNNTLAGRPVTLISSRSQDIITTVTSETDETGKQIFSVKTSEQGTATLRAMDLLSGNLLKDDLTIQAGKQENTIPSLPTTTATPSAPYPYGYIPYPTYPSPYFFNPYGASLLGSPLTAQLQSFSIEDHFDVIVKPELNVREDANLTIIVKDKNDKIVEDYTKTVKITSTDERAFLPQNGSVTFKPSDLGEKTLSLGLRFQTPGRHTLRVQDSTNENIRGEAIVNVIGGTTQTTQRSITITKPTENAVINSRQLTLEGNGPAFINFKILQLGSETSQELGSGDTKADGTFSVNLTLPEGSNTFRLQARGELGRHESKEITVTVDDVPPVLQSVSIVSRTEVIDITVVGEAGLPGVRTKVKGTATDEALTEATDTPGTYRVQLAALPPGEYPVTILATDAAGNVTEKTETLLIDGHESAPRPEISSVIFIPQSPQAGRDVQIAVQSSPGLSQMTLQLKSIDLTLPLSELPGAPGTYQGIFKAPAEGTYEATVTAVDQAGQAVEKTTSLTVLPPPAIIPPEIVSVTLSPAEPEQSTPVLAQVTAQAGLASVTLSIVGPNTSITLNENPDLPGSYQATFSAPPAGTYDIIVTAVDAQNVEAQRRNTLTTTEPKNPPVVFNLSATADLRAVRLTWNPVSEQIDHYQIYVGTQPETFDHVLQAGPTVPAAIIEGLNPGTTYYFTMTTVRGNRESDRSPAVSAIPEGMNITVTPEHSALLLDWSLVSAQGQPGGFALEYGIEPDTYTERRMLSGELQTYLIGDLINGITYFMKLTPIDSAGTPLTALSTTAQGTPTGEGFHLAPSDPVPFDHLPLEPDTLPTEPVTPPPSTLPPEPIDYSTVPSQPDSGIPIPLRWLTGGVLILGALLKIRSIQNRRIVRQFEQMLTQVKPKM